MQAFLLSFLPPRRNDDALLFLFLFFPLVCANAAWKEEEETARKQQCRKDQHISKWLHKKHWSLFLYLYDSKNVFILSKTAIELQEQQEVSRSRWRERSINQTRSGLPPFLLVPYFCVCARHISFSPKKGNFHLAASPPPDIEKKTTTTREAQSSV